jgi:hypothetical protein
MTNEELIECVKELQTDFEAGLQLRYMIVRTRADDKEYNRSVRDINRIRGLYEGALRLAQDRGISLENFFDYKEERL